MSAHRRLFSPSVPSVFTSNAVCCWKRSSRRDSPSVLVATSSGQTIFSMTSSAAGVFRAVRDQASHVQVPLEDLPERACGGTGGEEKRVKNAEGQECFWAPVRGFNEVAAAFLRSGALACNNEQICQRHKSDGEPPLISKLGPGIPHATNVFPAKVRDEGWGEISESYRIDVRPRGEAAHLRPPRIPIHGQPHDEVKEVHNRCLFYFFVLQTIQNIPTSSPFITNISLHSTYTLEHPNIRSIHCYFTSFKMVLPKATLLALLPYFLQANAQASGSGTTTRYWDCCKPSCSWPGKITLAAGSHPVTTCDIHDSPLTDYGATSGCAGGEAYMCSNESPWAVSEDLSYGFAATTIKDGSESSWCCACYELTFTSGAVAGKKMIVQATNTGSDLSANQFDISIPGGGVGIFNGCTNEWGAPSAGWGAQYGGIDSRSACDSFPEALKAGCYWRFDWFQGTSNPSVDFKQVACPAEITAKSGCARADDAINETPTGPSDAATWSSGASSPASTGAPGPAPSAEPTATTLATTSADPSAVQSGEPSVEPIPTETGTTTANGTAIDTGIASTEPAPTSIPSSAPSAGSGSGQTVAQWGQCGGTNWTGGSTCASGFTCKEINPYFSQCL
ncbi:hypothetical protein G7Y89_g2854 [Cudoniella acicularis]|uniref:Cellulase n=1 Tax=Cudoniella acicularis TaxID=354080 RepID=A0A8H4RSJ0_9HELO|nr:hypothetical protein G7Y89_g2854 [Cudoniella acicularis]